MPLPSLSPEDIDASSVRSRKRLPGIDLPGAGRIKFAARPVSSGANNEMLPTGGDVAEDSGDFCKNLQLDMRQMVGGAVGNMSISPNSRDIVLAARCGLFIIDLEANLKVPRFLPQGGTWDVADVQWNPHTYRGEYIVSTSSEKLLIWNLNAAENSNIQHTLSAHYRAITDINWHTLEPNVVSSTGIDSWIWTWDLREPKKPIFGLCAFNAPGTQVKWNRQDGNILASSHANEVLIWDRRKGSLPISKIPAHSSKIYGIDWSHHEAKEIVTCSLDKTIKVWDIDDIDSDGASMDDKAKAIINTAYPVWRARNLPFGRGVLSLAQRGETDLHLYATDDPSLPIHRFEGHSDVVKEFVWRRGGPDGNGYQLITWSKDRTLRFWALDSDIMERVGYVPLPVKDWDPEKAISYRTLSHATKTAPLLSAPVGHRSILAEVRAGSGAPAQRSANLATPAVTAPAEAKPPKMTRGPMSMSKSTARSGAGGVDGLTWLASVKVEDRRRGSGSNPGSDGINSAGGSRMSSRSRGVDDDDLRRSQSRSRSGLGALEESKESLQEEIKTVVMKLAPNKVKLEKHELTAKKRFCTIGLHGPWGQSSSVFVFMRITFTFPKDYPSDGPDSTPTVSLDQNPLVSINDRARILRKLKNIRETRRPCLEACLRYLLFKNENMDDKPINLDSESSDEGESEDDEVKKRDKEVTLALLRNNKNLAEPRTSQGSFGPNGELICFSRAPPRIVRNFLRVLSERPTKQRLSSPSTPDEIPRETYYRSPSLASEAIKRLESAAVDAPTSIQRRPEDHITRMMTNFLTFSQERFRSGFDDTSTTDRDRYVVPVSRSTVLLQNTSTVTGADRKAAKGYIFFVHDADGALNVEALCEKNAEAAVRCGRYDHARVFVTIGSILSVVGQKQNCVGKKSMLLWNLIKRFMTELAAQKDVQLLAMVAMTILQIVRPFPTGGIKFPTFRNAKGTPFRSGYSDGFGSDYFSLRRGGHAQHLKSSGRESPKSPIWPHLPSSPGSPLPPLSASESTNSSRAGSWSSLFTPNNMRQFMADRLTGVQDSLKDGLVTPVESSRASSVSRTTNSIPIPAGHNRQEPASPQPPHRKSGGSGRESLFSRSWNDGQRRSSTVSFSPSKSIVSTMTTATAQRQSIPPKKKIVFEPAPVHEMSYQQLPFERNEIQTFLQYVKAYAEVLFRWELHQKRLELLKAVHPHVPPEEIGQHEIGVVRTCRSCNATLTGTLESLVCPSCNNSAPMPNCAVCRLPANGLSQSCIRCLHIVHMSCKRRVNIVKCPSGCGCTCRWR